TVLFADLVGFTALAEFMDPEQATRLINRCFAQLVDDITDFGGRVDKVLGDGILALFGAPVAHEDDPERAVRAALSVRDAFANDELDLRIGVTTGEGLVALDARPESGEGLVSGDVVNTAARLQTAAAPGSVLVDEATYRATSSTIEYGGPEKAELKGKEQMATVRVALRARVPIGVDRLGSAPFVGREHELDVLRETLRRVGGTRRPELVTVVGVPGIGKSRLVHELVELGRTGTLGAVSWYRGRSLPYGEGGSFWAWGEIVRAQTGILESDATGARVAKLEDAVEAVVADPAEADWVRRHLSPLVGIEGIATGDDRTAETFAAWRRFLEGLAEQSTVALVFDDLHWAEAGMLDFVASLSERVTDAPLFVLGTARAELLERRPAWASGTNATLLPLEPLSDAEAMTLTEALVHDSGLAENAGAVVVRQAGGNPLYAEQYVRMLSEHGETQGVPATLQALIAARLDASPRPRRRSRRTQRSSAGPSGRARSLR
ncbi:MAG: AAA family ATPase, partial [Gaiellaceae bacterium]